MTVRIVVAGFGKSGRCRIGHWTAGVIPAAVDDDSTGVSGGWYRAPGWQASEHASEGAAPNETLTDRR
jgi:hypothetical protein